MPRRPALRPYEGACHCGSLEFTYETHLAPRSWPVRTCQCAFCRGHGAQTTSDPEGAVRFRYVQPDRLRRYRFALRTADFLVCRECGMYLGAVLMTGAGAVATVNVNLLKDRPRGVAAARPVRYANETPDERRARRREIWTPVYGPV